MEVSFTLTGEMPLLMHWDNIEGSDVLKEWRQAPENKNASIPGDDRSPPWAWQHSCYNDGEKVAMPQENVMRAIMDGGAQVIIKRNKTFKQLSQSGLVMASEYLDFSYGPNGAVLKMEDLDAIRELDFRKQTEAVEQLGFRLFVKRGSIGTTKHVRVRPRFDLWKVQGVIRVVVKDITFEVLEAIFLHAGRSGLCDWRPSSPKRPGPYGVFSATLKKV